MRHAFLHFEGHPLTEPNGHGWDMKNAISNGTVRARDGKKRIYYDGYWLRCYDPPLDSLAAKKRLIEALTRRLFNHVEHGINIPGKRLDEVRAAYDAETDAELKRVKGAMLAGALFNRAADIFTRLVELQEMGVSIDPDDSLMNECGRCLIEALEFGKSVRHRSGEESIDELWGEPFKAFSISISAFYESRYIKIAQTMRDIDRIAAAMAEAFRETVMFPEAPALIREFAEAAKLKVEVLRTDPEIFHAWPKFVVASQHLCQLEARFPDIPTKASFRRAAEGKRVLKEGTALLTHIARARVPMPKSTEKYLRMCENYRLDRTRLEETD
jgi:hypothetical protein